ncbi:hypothetical protein [Bradyrhizobium sp. I1.7.5]
MKKVDMAEAAEQLLAGTDWLLTFLRAVKLQERTDTSTSVSDAFSQAAE